MLSEKTEAAKPGQRPGPRAPFIMSAAGETAAPAFGRLLPACGRASARPQRPSAANAGAG
ncbi:MAG: hypothetical protein DBY09_08395 [Selenomonadales bacterium]|nr:MAG: hypothetical protein DBY09_08395 [Selenomonadales bacterium]